MDKLKTCPFCGAELEKRSNNRGKIVYMHPLNGCIILKVFITTDEDLMEWNRRADDGIHKCSKNT